MKGIIDSMNKQMSELSEVIIKLKKKVELFKVSNPQPTPPISTVSRCFYQNKRKNKKNLMKMNHGYFIVKKVSASLKLRKCSNLQIA